MILKLCGISLDIVEEDNILGPEETLYFSNMITEVRDKYEVPPVEANSLVQHLAMLKTVYWAEINDIKKHAKNEEDANEKIKTFNEAIFGNLKSDYRLLFFFMRVMYENYMQYLVDTKVDIDDISKYYKNNPEAYTDPQEFDMMIYIYDLNNPESSKDFSNFLGEIAEDKPNEEAIAKYDKYAARRTVNSISIADEDSVVDNIYNMVSSLEPGQFSKPRQQETQNHKMGTVIRLIGKRKCSMKKLEIIDEAQKAIAFKYSQDVFKKAYEQGKIVVQ